MSVGLQDLIDCFEGVIPSLVATLDAHSEPNVSYLSQVWYVDPQHVALSNQFFSKTLSNVEATGAATAVVVDGRTGDQYELGLSWVSSSTEGELYERMAAQLRAISSQHGMDAVMALRSAELFRVETCCPVPVPAGVARMPAQVRAVSGAERLAGAARVTTAMASETDPEALVHLVLNAMVEIIMARHAMILVPEPGAARLVTLASRGYPASGVGSEVRFGEGTIGIAAETRQSVRLCDMSRGRRMAKAVLTQASPEDARTIPLPGLAEPQSQIAVPMIARGAMFGVLFAEDPARFRFTREDQDALALLGAQLAAGLLLAEVNSTRPPVRTEPPAVQPAGRPFRVKYFTFDDSLFIDDAYVIKGVAGRLLYRFLCVYLTEGRSDFTNRELRLDATLRLPELKDNLETRLILLRRRLEERGAPVQLLRPERGRIRLAFSGPPELVPTAGTEI